MSYRDLSPRWIPERTVRALGLAAVLLAGLGMALFAPAESLAEAGGRHRVSVGARPAPNGMLYLESDVRDADGELLMAPRITAIPGETVVMTTQKGERLYRLTVTAAADGSGLAKLEVLDGDELVDSVLHNFSSTRGRSRPPAETITLRFVDADVDDFAAAVSQMTGMKVSVAKGLEGKVTVDVRKTPWPEAVARALESIGAAMVIRGGEILFVPAGAEPTPTPRAAARSGYERIGPGVTPPRIITRVDPIFPAEANAARIQGIVILEALIGADGLVHEVKALKGLPFGLDQAALDAVRQWTFAPALRDGEPVGVVFNLTINFKLADEDAPAEEAAIQSGPDGEA